MSYEKDSRAKIVKIKMMLPAVTSPHGGAAKAQPHTSAESVKAGIFEPIRSICESKDLQFFVVLQSASSPTQRFWTSSKQLNNLCGNLIFEFATYVDIDSDNIVPDPAIGESLDVKIDVEDCFTKDDSLDPPFEIDDPAPNVASVDEVVVSDDECVLLPEEDLDDDGVEKPCGEGTIWENKASNGQSRNEDPCCDLLDLDFLWPFKRKQPLRNPNLLATPPTEKSTRGDISLTDDENTLYLDDDEENANNSANNTTLSETPAVPVIWKHHEFDRGIRPSTMKRLFADKVMFDKKQHANYVKDSEYCATLLKIIKKRNPYCVFYPKRLCQFFPKKRPSEYFAEFLCRYSSCELQAHVRIECSQSFMVRVEFLARRTVHNQAKVKAKAKVKSECPYLYFKSHDESRTTQLMVDKQYFKKNAIDADDLGDAFLSQLVEGRDRVDGERKGNDRIVSTIDYIDALQPVLSSANPSCRFTVPQTECFVRCNKRKDDREIRIFSVKLLCAFEECPMRVTVHVSNPEGNVTLHFTKTKLCDDPTGEHDGDGDMMDIDHSGTLSSALDENASEPLLTIPSFIQHDELIPHEDLEREFLCHLPTDPNAPLIRDHMGPGSNHIAVTKAIVERYNPICQLVCRMSKILRKTNEFKIWHLCKYRDCDFQALVIIRDDGRVRLEMENHSILGEKPQFCYIRHSPDERNVGMRQQFFHRGVSRQRFLEENKEFLMRSAVKDIAEKFNVTTHIARRLRMDVKGSGVDKKPRLKKTPGLIKARVQQRKRSKANARAKAIHPNEEAIIPTDVKVDGSNVAFEETCSGPLWTLPSLTQHDERIPQPVLQKEFLSALHDDHSLIKDCLNSETNHKEVTKPIMEKYNPICQLACYGSRILKTTSQFKVWWSCKRDGCDFIGTCIVEGLTGKVRCELRNKKSGPTITSQFCYIRHDKTVVVPGSKKFRKRRPGIIDLNTRDLAEKYNVSMNEAVLMKRRSVARALKRRVHVSKTRKTEPTGKFPTVPVPAGGKNPFQQNDSTLLFPRRVLCEETLPPYWFDQELCDISTEELQRYIAGIIRRYNPICDLRLVGEWRMPEDGHDFDCCYRCDVPNCDFQLEFVVNTGSGTVQMLLENISKKSSDAVTINHVRVDETEKEAFVFPLI